MVKTRSYLPPPWLLVLIGLVLNIAAILLTSVVLDKLSQANASIAEQKADNLYSIQRAWDSVEVLERKREMLLLHVHLNQSSSLPLLIEDAMRGHLSSWTGQEIGPITPEQLPELMGQINQAQSTLREQIDNHYLNNLDLAEEMLRLADKMSWYKSIALFLQVFGLALILARDLARKP
ncbi:DNA mismatch repair protein [Vibrio alfacsensis]|uniref:DNA mismatch repair protein n=1 Tax=Vibrio alfacsensis TaxID=1074311 RepID=UPI001BF092DE|nr:DNA mismatch repair protein [Vibrio alfacsensis]BCN26003.1 hypothetical protein VYA_31950 [Vibrio alfacsensis]